MNGFYIPVFVYSIIHIALLLWMLVLRLFVTVINVTEREYENLEPTVLWGEHKLTGGYEHMGGNTLPDHSSGLVGKMLPRQTL